MSVGTLKTVHIHTSMGGLFYRQYNCQKKHSIKQNMKPQHIVLQHSAFIMTFVLPIKQSIQTKIVSWVGGMRCHSKGYHRTLQNIKTQNIS
nr:MAG TPA: hypothetical protein [Caudoviricetes sp.]DAT28785.1 MAG TPA: hypothetical protein [Caudoviricetes sp.]